MNALAHYRSHTMTALPLLMLLFSIGAAQLARAADPVIGADKIREEVIDAGQTRSFRGDRREGLVFESSRGFGEGARGLAMVDETVSVDPGAHISLPLTFALDSASTLTGSSEKQLKELAKALKSAPAGTQYLIEGHTCILGETEHNNRLSIERANFVVDYLVKSGVPTKTLRSLGLGSAEAKKHSVPADAGDAVLAPYRKVMIHRVFKAGS